MSTRANVVFMQDDEQKAVIYKHWDGYPTGFGHELAEFLDGKKIVNGIRPDAKNIFNGMGCLAASVVAHFKEGPGDVYLDGKVSEWVDYTYVVQQDKETINIHVKEDGFTGTPNEFITHYAEEK